MGRTSAEILKQIGNREPPPPLSPTAPYSSAITLDIDSLEDGQGVKAALHLLNDDIDRCHRIAQAHEGVPTFDYLHAILHRREKDFENSKYWFNRLDHPLLARIYPSGRPHNFVDETQQAERENGENDMKDLQQKQNKEMFMVAEYAMEHGL